MNVANHLLIALLMLLPLTLLGQENTGILCGDGIDNDGDGFIDCEDSDCDNLPGQGCAICPDGLSFADVLIEYNPGCSNIEDPDPTGALGVSDWPVGSSGDKPEFVFLGVNGSIKLEFTNNLLTNSGDNNEDLWVFEVGVDIEDSALALRPADAFTETQLQLLGIPDTNGDGFYEVGNIDGATTGFDIDNVMLGYAPETLLFDAVELTDLDNGNCQTQSTPGADIQAVCALYSIVANEEIDCLGIENGTAVIDECGECLQPNDPNFNQSCIDCEGTINGTAVIDDCGTCLQPNDPSFNQSCIDCEGTINGTAIIDDCGTCLQPNAPNFNQSCLPDNVLIFPTAFTPNNDNLNDVFQPILLKDNNPEVRFFYIYNRWGQQVYSAKNFSFRSNLALWDGTFKNKPQPIGVFLYYVEVELLTGQRLMYKGNVTLIR